MIATSFALSSRNTSKQSKLSRSVHQPALHRESSPTLRWLSDGSNPEFTEKSITAAGWLVGCSRRAGGVNEPAWGRGRLKVVGID